MRIVKEDKEPLFARKKILLEMDNEKSTPNLDNVKNQIVDFLKVKPELLRIRNVYTRFGDTKVDVISYIYDNIESLQRFEIIKKKVKKEKAKEEKKEEEKPK